MCEVQMKARDTLFDFEVTKLQAAWRISRAAKTGVYGDEVPPVPIPNTEVKLISVENTWLATAWEDRAMPVQITRRFGSPNLFGVYCPLAQSVERMTVNHDVVSSSLTGAANKPSDQKIRWFFLAIIWA